MDGVYIHMAVENFACNVPVKPVSPKFPGMLHSYKFASRLA